MLKCWMKVCLLFYNVSHMVGNPIDFIMNTQKYNQTKELVKIKSQLVIKSVALCQNAVLGHQITSWESVLHKTNHGLYPHLWSSFSFLWQNDFWLTRKEQQCHVGKVFSQVLGLLRNNRLSFTPIVVAKCKIFASEKTL